MLGSTCAILFCVIYGSLLNFDCVSAFDLAEHLTNDEKLQIFGSHEVPEHQIVETSWPRHKRSEENIVFPIELHGKRRQVNLKQTDGFLVSEHTPVWTATSDPASENGVRYEVLYHNAPKHLGKIRCYHDLETEAAVTVFYNSQNVGTMEGMINLEEGLVIKSLPLSATTKAIEYNDQTQLIGNHQIKVRWYRSVSQDDEPKNATRNIHVVFKMRSNQTDGIKSIKQVVRRQAESSETSVVYPEILVIADCKMAEDQTNNGLLKSIIAFWNAMDLPFSRLTNPRVRLAIGGVILVKDQQALEYLPVRADGAIYEIDTRLSEWTKKIGAKHPVASDLNLFDMVMIMVNHALYDVEYDVDEPPYHDSWLDGEVTNVGDSCPVTDSSDPKRYHPGVGIFVYMPNFWGVDNGIMQLARLLGARDDVNQVDGRCSADDAFAMSTFKYLPRRRKMDWSQCSINYFRDHLKKPINECLKNEPRWRVLEYNENINR